MYFAQIWVVFHVGILGGDKSHKLLFYIKEICTKVLLCQKAFEKTNIMARANFRAKKYDVLIKSETKPATAILCISHQQINSKHALVM